MFVIVALACFLPIIFIFMISITDKNVIRTEGYQFFVTARTFSGEAYKYLWSQRQTILHALWVSVYVTALGTCLGVMLTALMGYGQGYNDEHQVQQEVGRRLDPVQAAEGVYQVSRGANQPLTPMVATLDVKVYQMLTSGTVSL